MADVMMGPDSPTDNLTLCNSSSSSGTITELGLYPLTLANVSLAASPPLAPNPLVQANLFFRVSLGLIALLACFVPMRLLWRSGELSAAVFCLTISMLNVAHVVNALVWRDDDVRAWPAGYWWCDVQMYVKGPLQLLFATCIFTIMQHLARQLGMSRVAGLTSAERRRRNWLQAAVLFPVPLLQAAMTYPVLSQRYSVSTLIGCRPVYDATWPLLVFFLLPHVVYSVGTLYYAVLIGLRFHEIERSTMAARGPQNASMATRHQRVRKKLYLMALSVLIPYVPVQVVFLSSSIAYHMPWTLPYNFNALHSPERDPPWDTVFLFTSNQVSFFDMNVNYIPILTVIPVFWWFGMTKDAVNVYRSCLVALGFGRLFPRLKEEYDPDQQREGTMTTTSSSTWSNRVSVLWSQMRKSQASQSLLPRHSTTTGTNTQITRDKPRTTIDNGYVNLSMDMTEKPLPQTTEEDNGRKSRHRNDICRPSIPNVRNNGADQQQNTWPELPPSVIQNTRRRRAIMPLRYPFLFCATPAGPIRLPSLSTGWPSVDAHFGDLASSSGSDSDARTMDRLEEVGEWEGRYIPRGAAGIGCG